MFQEAYLSFPLLFSLVPPPPYLWQKLLSIPKYLLTPFPFSNRPTHTYVNTFLTHCIFAERTSTPWQWSKWDIVCVQVQIGLRKWNFCLPFGLLFSSPSLECGCLGSEVALTCTWGWHPMAGAGRLFSVQGQIVPISGFVSYVISVTTSQPLCHCTGKQPGCFLHKWAWPWASKTLFTVRSGRPDLALELE